MSNNALGYIVVSDLHLGPGRRPQAPEFYKRVEDFFYDDEFASLLTALNTERAGKGPDRWRLIINGDLAEFLQIPVWPQPQGTNNWQLGNGVVVRRLDFETPDGLATGPEKSAWKLGVISEGHSPFFQALAQFINAGNDLIIIKGNHDAEFYWPEVRKKFVEILVAALPCPGMSSLAFNRAWNAGRYVDQPEQVWSGGGTLQFCSLSYCDGPLYVEHGNQHDPANRFGRFGQPVHPLFDDPQRGETFIELPFGSIFVRYFFNEVEKYFCYADNVKPMADAIREIWNRQPLLTIRILMRKAPRLLGALTYPPVWLRLGRVLKPAYVTYFLIAASLFLWPSIEALRHGPFRLQTFIAAYEHWRWLYALVAAAFPFFADFFAESESCYLRGAAAKKFAEFKTKPNNKICFFVYGHTHDPDIWKIGDENAWYFNTGTWTIVFSVEERLTRSPLQLAFLRVECDNSSPIGWCAELACWNDSAAQQQKSLVLEEDSPGVRRQSRGYLKQAHLPIPPQAPDEYIPWSSRVWNTVGVPVKRLWEFLLGIPASVLWATLCLVAHLLRPFWRALKRILTLRFRGLWGYFRRDLILLAGWMRVSWEVLSS